MGILFLFPEQDSRMISSFRCFVYSTPALDASLIGLGTLARCDGFIQRTCLLDDSCSLAVCGFAAASTLSPKKFCYTRLHSYTCFARMKDPGRMPLLKRGCMAV